MRDLRITHIGGPTVLLEVEGWTLLTDPTFDPPGRTYRFALGTSSRKVRGPALEPDALPPVDAVLVTHDHHADNLDGSGRDLLSRAGTVVTTTAGARRLGRTAVGLRPWASTTLEAPGRPPITVTATPCRHGPPLSRPLVGDVVGFSLAWPGQEHGVVWISGDTVLTPAVRRVADRIEVDLAVLHLGGAAFGLTGPIRYTMTARQGIELCRHLRPRRVVPVHYEGWSHFRDGREGLERALGEAPPELAERFTILPLGEAVVLAG